MCRVSPHCSNNGLETTVSEEIKRNVSCGNGVIRLNRHSHLTGPRVLSGLTRFSLADGQGRVRFTV